MVDVYIHVLIFIAIDVLLFGRRICSVLSVVHLVSISMRLRV